MDNMDFCAYVNKKLFFDCAKYISPAAALVHGNRPRAAIKGDVYNHAVKSDIRPAVALCVWNSYPL